MNILLIGSGGREHAFAWKITQSPKCRKLFVAPGNPGTADIATNLPIGVSDFDAIKEAILHHAIELLVIGPEEPLVKGLVDFLAADPETENLLIVGPPKVGAKLEGSKDFSKRFMMRHKIPTAAYETFDSQQLDQGLAYLENQSLPIVLKADGLAAGKGVLICQTLEEAKTSLREMLIDQKFGEASSKVVVEEFLQGIELSVFIATDGKNYLMLPEAKDYKRIGEGDTGLNTGGMGAISPVAFADTEFLKKVEERIVQPTIAGLSEEDIPYRGFLFIGLMNRNGDPFVIEYNVRMGDPETEAVLPRITSDFVDLLSGIAGQTLQDYELILSDDHACTVVLVSGGYPEGYEKGHPIHLPSLEGQALIFHAGTKRNEAGLLVNHGGRVLAITGKGPTLDQAMSQAFKTVHEVHWKNQYYRKDIGQDIMKLTNNPKNQE